MATSNTQLSLKTTKENFPIAHQNSNHINIQSINSDIIAHVFGYLEGFDIDNASATCRKWVFGSKKNFDRERFSIKRLAHDLFGSLMISLNKQTYKTRLYDEAKKIAAELIRLIPLHQIKSVKNTIAQ